MSGEQGGDKKNKEQSAILHLEDLAAVLHHIITQNVNVDINGTGADKEWADALSEAVENVNNERNFLPTEEQKKLADTLIDGAMEYFK